jgi:tetratricopeptide (TPR) repeat protein
MYDKAIADFIFVNKRKSGMASLLLAKTEARLNHKELSIKYLREHLSSSYKIPEKDILLDEDLNRFESSSAWKTLWKEKNWYSVYDQKLQEVAYLRSNGDLLEALNQLDELEEKGYKRSLTNQFIAEIYLSTGNRKSAIEALNKSIRSDTRNLESLKLRIEFLMNDGDFDEANADCDRLLRQAPYEFEYYLISGEINSHLGNYDAAKKSIDFYINYFPNSFEAFNKLGKIHYDNGKYLNALSALNRSLELNDGYAESFFNRGLTYAATKTYKYAERDLSMALDLDPLNGDIWFEKGLVDKALGKIDTACFDFRKALQYGRFDARENIEQLCSTNYGRR